MIKQNTSSVVLLSFPVPFPDIELLNLAAWDCGNDESQLPVPVSAENIPVCVKGHFKVGAPNSGPFSIVYVASVSGTVMGFIPVIHPIDMCPEGPW